MAHILIVEDRESLRRMLERALGEEGHRVTVESDVKPAVERLQRGEAFDLVLTDLKLPSGSGLDVVSAAKRGAAAPPVVVMTAYGTIGAAVEAMKRGAADFLEKPVELGALYSLVRALAGDQEVGSEALELPGVPPIVGRHPRLRAALRLLQRVAPTPTAVLLTGESGTGKELFARAVHALSPRASGPFVAVNCAAIPESLVESELFGHERGAFTGADRRRSGRFERARGGTLFLDEVGELPLAVQAKVLRVLDDQRFERVGGGETLTADVRVVAATNRDLAARVANGEFRNDLLYRLEIFPIPLPSLAERRDDVPLLVRHLLARHAARHGARPPEPTAEALRALAERPWPGNVRQLSNLLERAVILHAGERLGFEALAALAEPADAVAADDEEEQLRCALDEAEGDKKLAAERLGISYRTLLRRVRAHDLQGYPRYRR